MVCLWWLWKWRNESIFGNKSWDLSAKVMKIKEYMGEIESAFCDTNIILNQGRQPIANWVRWEKTIYGWAKLDKDGCSRKNTRSARVWGVLRDWKGEWIGGVAKRLGDCSDLWSPISLGKRYRHDDTII